MKEKIVEQNEKFTLSQFEQFGWALQEEELVRHFKFIENEFLKYMDVFYEIEAFDEEYQLEVNFLKEFFNFHCEKIRF